MKFLLPALSLITTLLIPSMVKASEEIEVRNMEQMLGSIRLEKKQIESMVDKMVTSGRLSAEEGKKAKREIASLKEDDMENLKASAIAEVKSRRSRDH